MHLSNWAMLGNRQLSEMLSSRKTTYTDFQRLRLCVGSGLATLQLKSELETQLTLLMLCVPLIPQIQN